MMYSFFSYQPLVVIINMYQCDHFTFYEFCHMVFGCVCFRGETVYEYSRVYKTSAVKERPQKIYLAQKIFWFRYLSNI